MQFADRLKNVETSAIRDLFKLLGKPGIISFAGGFPAPELFDVEGIELAAAQVLANNGRSVLQYGATEGWEPLREALSEYMANRGIEVSAQDIITTTGSQQALDLVAKSMINSGDKVIVEAPTFLATIQCFRLYGADLVTAPVDENGVEVDELERLIVEHRPRLVYLIPNFGNPSGATLSLERRRKIVDLAVRHKVLIVEDDAYGELYFCEPPPQNIIALGQSVPGARNWIAYCGSFSKVLSPGLRVGWLMAHQALLAKAVMCKQFGDAHTSNLSQAIAAQYLSMNRWEYSLNRVRKTYSERALSMETSLRNTVGERVKFRSPKGGMFLWAQLTESGFDSTVFAKRAIDNKVAIVPGAPFFATNADRSTFRLSFATANPEQISEGVRRLAQSL